MKVDIKVFEAGDFALDSGATLHGTRLAYCTFGTLSARRDNVVVVPTYYTGSHRECAQMIGPGRALDPARWFIVVVNLFGNAVSSSPSNTPGKQAGAGFPNVSIADNVRCQRRLLLEHFSVERIALAVGWSMGALQCYEWAASEPSSVAAIAAVCGSARASEHNRVFLDGVRAALEADPDFDHGRYSHQPLRGLGAFGRVYAGWAYSQAFFRDGMYRELGCGSAEQLLERWDEEHRGWDANDLLAMLATWRSANIGDNPRYKGDFEAALGAIEARAIVMPCRTDLYFPTDDSRHEVAHMRNAELREIDSRWGHIAGSPLYDEASTRFVDAAIADLLA